jgi:hypothetical protein
MAASPSFASRYTVANKNTFMNESLDAAIEAWPKYFSKKLVVTQNGKTMDYEGFLQQMKDAKKSWPIIDVRYKMLTESGRTVASAEYVWIPSDKIWFDTIIVMTFGDVGTEDENKVVTFLEIMQPGPADRDPAAPEAQSIA